MLTGRLHRYPERVFLFSLGLSLGFLSVSSVPSSAQIQFNFADAIHEGTNAVDAVIVDLNEDGWPDLALLTGAGPSILLLSEGTGGFESLSLPTPSSARRIEAADLDADGHQDLVMSHEGQIQIRLGDGTGGFSPGVDFTAGDEIVRFRIADINGDECLDVVGLDDRAIDPDEVTVLLGDGNGGFGTRLGSMVSFPPCDFVLLDSNGDEIPDLVTIGCRFGLRLLVGLGGGSFSEAFGFGDGMGLSLAAADLNEDGLTDVVSSHRNRDVQVSLADGSGGFLPSTRVGTGLDDGSELLIGDWNEDGNLDVAAASYRKVMLFRGDGKGALTGRSHLGLKTSPRRIYESDLNLDGHPDIVSLEESRVSILRGEGTGFFSVVQPRDNIDGAVEYGAVDLNEDGHVDIVHNTSFSTRFYLGTGFGTFGPRTSPFAIGPARPSFADFNGDGTLDVVAVFGGSNPRVSTYFGDGKGGFDPPLDQAVPDLSTTLVHRVVSADFDGDGIADLAVALTGDRIGVIRGSSAGFEPPQIVSSGLLFLPNPLLSADLNGDGNADLLVSRSTSPHVSNNRVTVLWGDGGGGLQIVQHLAGNEFSLLLDEDGDGALDLFTGDFEGIDVARGSEVGCFQEPVPFSGLSAVGRFAAGDLNGDGDVEFMVPRHNGLLVQESDGNGKYLSPDLIPFNDSPKGVALADFDGDGTLDLVGGDLWIWILLNRTPFYRSREGNVNEMSGPVADLVSVNGKTGHGRSRTLLLSKTDPFSIEIDAAPSGGTQFVVYAWNLRATPQLVRDPGFDLGQTSLPMPLSHPTGRRRPKAIWKTIPGYRRVLGTETRPAVEAPSVLLDLQALGVTGEFFVQGLIFDTAAPNGQVAVTNGIRIISR